MQDYVTTPPTMTAGATATGTTTRTPRSDPALPLAALALGLTAATLLSWVVVPEVWARPRTDVTHLWIGAAALLVILIGGSAMLAWACSLWWCLAQPARRRVTPVLLAATPVLGLVLFVLALAPEILS